jgi:hypothetical protein
MSYSKLENLIEKIKANGLDENLNMDKVNAELEDFRQKMPQIGKEKNIREAEKLAAEIQTLAFQIQIAIDGGMGIFTELRDDFNTIKWKDRAEARQLIDQGMNVAIQALGTGKIPNMMPFVVKLIELLPEEMKKRFLH